MHLITSLLLLVPAVQDWSAHPLPSICSAPAHIEGPALLGSGTHIDLRPEAYASRLIPEASLAPSLLTQLISGAFNRSSLTLVPGSNPLLVRSTQAEANRLRSIFAALDDAGDRLQIQLQVSLLNTAAPNASTSPHLSGDTSQTAPGAHYSGTTRSGDTISFGVRSQRNFVGGFDTEVSTDAGVAEPLRSLAYYGETLHLLCCRVRSGTAVHIEGLLDLATIPEVRVFDPDTPDLGQFEQPRVSICQIAFSGVATPDEPLRVLIQGSAAFGERTLIISATTQADPAPSSIGWIVRDLAFLDSPGLPLTGPQADLRRRYDKRPLPKARTQTAPASLVGLLTERSSIGSDSGRIHSTERLLLIPADNPSALARTEALIAAMEAPLLNPSRCSVHFGDTQLDIPLTHGRPLRVLLGEEQPYLVDYNSDIAPNSWMPNPVSEVVFDGLCLEGVGFGAEVQTRWWIATTGSVQIAGIDTAHLGALQQPERHFSAGQSRIARGVTQATGTSQHPLTLTGH